MLARYRIYMRQKRPADDPLPQGVRQDTRKHTRHCLRPDASLVRAYLANPTDEAWRKFEKAYRRSLAQRFAEDRKPFDELAALARKTDVYFGCNCPTRTNPDVRQCHTTPALGFMQEHYPDLVVVLPESRDG